VYSEDKKLSLDFVIEFLQSLYLILKIKIPTILIKAKSDLNIDQIESDGFSNFMENNNIHFYYETSAKTGQNVTDVFQKIAELLLKDNGLIY
jgi:GTPase SAR1 family protein